MLFQGPGTTAEQFLEDEEATETSTEGGKNRDSKRVEILQFVVILKMCPQNH